MKKILYISGKNSRMPAEGPFIDALKKLGAYTDFPYDEAMSKNDLAELIRQYDILLTMWDNVPIPVEVASDKGKLEYICNLTGSVKGWIPIEMIDAGISVTNWGDAPANDIAEGAMTLLLATMKDLHARIMTIREDGWRPAPDFPGGSLEDLNVGIYGLGVIGQRFVELIRPFRPILRVYDPYISEVPEDCIRADSLEALFESSQAIVIHAGLCEETVGSVTAQLLAKLPDQGIIINTARGRIIDQDALFKELSTGRLRAGLDVLDYGDRLPPGHPARKWVNCILTSHSIGMHKWGKPEMNKYFSICLDNLQRYIKGEPLRFMMDRERYLRST